ncbi:MAG: glycogen debranching enzyme GlgX [Acidobacteria bacterium]|nr:MAG: glycogen debranching enzyme GlgX [Acidobacteriota bacterium]
MSGRPRRSSETPPPLGLSRSELGTEAAVLARHATAVDLCVFEGRHEERVPLRRSAHGVWWDVVPDLAPGTRYGFRVDGPWVPHQGHRHNPSKLLLDPYGHAVEGWVRWNPAVYGHVVGADGQARPDVRDERDSAPFVPRSVVVDHAFDWRGDVAPSVPWSDTVVYEAHVRGLTMRHPDVPPHLQGTYAALGHPAVVEHLVSLGVTTLELLPVHAYASEPDLVRRGLYNYWGYNTLGFFAPHPGYAAADDPQGVVDELKGAIRTLHAAGIEVVLDVVYNHTAEQASGSGPTLSWRGFDNRTYYRLDDHGRDVDVTGTGNTVDLRDPLVTGMVLDSLRHWVQEYHVDGFRFDLAPALVRGADDAYERDHPFHVALRTDPVLSRVKLIAEPWDVGVHGWRTGQFPPPVVEWNDRFRDAVRSFWLADAGGALRDAPGHGVRELASRLAGSADLFGHEDRAPLASVNFVAAHDGFTLADLTAYEQKHNLANGEDNRDGHGDNRSWNHGVEGTTGDPAVLADRDRSVRNLLATLLLSPGVPMLAAGDEAGRTQDGNNNAYNQDNSTSWLSWRHGPARLALLRATRELLALRRELELLRPSSAPTPDPVAGRTRLRWFDDQGVEMSPAAWEDPWRRTVVALHDTLHEPERRAVALVLHAGAGALDVVVPKVEGVAGWTLRWSSEQEAQVGAASAPGDPLAAGARSFTVLLGTPTR